MNKKNYKPLFNKFKQEIKDTNNRSFKNVDNWTIADDLLNGVLIGYTIKERSERELLHHKKGIGVKA